MALFKKKIEENTEVKKEETNATTTTTTNFQEIVNEMKQIAGIQEQKELKTFTNGSEPMSVTYSGIPAKKLVITQIIVGNVIVNEKIEEKATIVNITEIENGTGN